MILQVSSSRVVPVCHQAHGAAMPQEIGRTVEHGYFTIIGPAVNRTNRLLPLVKRLDQPTLVWHVLRWEIDQPQWVLAPPEHGGV
jgi:hypothetical protein